MSLTTLALPNKAKSEIIKPFAKLVADNVLDDDLIASIKALKQHSPGLIIGETHSHSTFSDGGHSVETIFTRGATLGLDFVTITEHLTHDRYFLEQNIASIEEQDRVRKYWNHEGLKPPVCYPALEVSTNMGHLITLFPEEYYKPNMLKQIHRYFQTFDKSLPPAESVARLTCAMGGVTIIPHPGISRSYPFGMPLSYIEHKFVEYADSIEDICTAHALNEKYSHRFGLASIGASDDHLNILCGTTVTAFQSSKYPDLQHAIKKRGTMAIRVSDKLDPLFTPVKLFFKPSNMISSHI